jgi:hypothetical protein
MKLPSGFDVILGLPWFQKWRLVFDGQPPISATISASQRTVVLLLPLELPPTREMDFEINLMPGSTPVN